MAYVKVSSEDLEKMILEIIRVKGEAVPAEILRDVEARLGGPVDPRLFRKVLADLVRKGVVRREPREEISGFVFKL
ncbi:MAG: hypothetical protein F7C34_01045 [Desulfurococcales archaeon]|nr:hypothetical protein [Desulfurococcales archaeon]